MKYFLIFILLHLIVGTPQINLHFTDWINEIDNDKILQHDCLRFAAIVELIAPNDHQIMSYCISESSSKFKIESNNIFPKFTFAELSKENITSQQLYLWSTPIDIIEDYQFYLNQLSITNDSSSLETRVFYNCTLPRFGSMCQYELIFYSHRRSTLYEIIYDFYYNYPYYPTNITCYIHLKCDRGSLPGCLDWSEICDGKIDCSNGGFDEEHCWELELNECKNDEFRCTNGQCIPESFYTDNTNIPDCFDTSDESLDGRRELCRKYEQPSVGCEDVKCIRTPLTPTCMEERVRAISGVMYSIEDSSLHKNCWSTFKCMLKTSDSEDPSCDELCEPNTCIEIVKKTCPDILYFPSIPVLFDDIYFAYPINDSEYLSNHPGSIPYICYSNSHYADFFVNDPKISFNNKTCADSQRIWPRRTQPIVPSATLYLTYYTRISQLYEMLKRYHFTFNYTSVLYNKSKIYQCMNSLKYISIYRLTDGVHDCPHMDDENTMIINNTDLLKHVQRNYFKCQISNKSIHPSLVGNNICDCNTTDLTWCEDENAGNNYVKTNILFQNICDGFIELTSLIIDTRNETDETECEQWECNNIYTRCNSLWNCLDGADERGCISYSTLNCSSNHYLCVSPITNQLMCLSAEKINDDNIDCLGATDERALCKEHDESDYSYGFYCGNRSSTSCVSSYDLCDARNDCTYGDDEQFCKTNITSLGITGICIPGNYLIASTVEKLLCDYLKFEPKQQFIPFTLDGMGNSDTKASVRKMKKIIFSSSSNNEIPDEYEPRCHRGLDLRVWLNNKTNSVTTTCLCPPSFYGDSCQYQNQRISLALKFRALSDSWGTLFSIVILLIDNTDDQIIHSFEQFSYLSLRDCKTKFNINLVYAIRPKNPTKNYTIQIDIYEKIKLIHRGSILIPVIFPFLPVQRFALIINIPRSDDKTQICSDDQCIHGKCMKYSNNPKDLTFCHCEQGWSGRYCTIEYKHICAFDSLSIGVSINNRSICICSIHRFGSRCLLNDTICQQKNTNLTCQNNGQCIPNDDHIISKQKFVCICPKGFSGDRCEFADNKLILLFDQLIVLSQSISVHFIEVMNMFEIDKSIVRSSTFRTMSVIQNSVTIFWSRPFHLVFIELSNKKYYLTVNQNIYNQSRTINKMIQPLDRCPNITELFNKTFIQWHLIRRIKYYHLPCQNQTLNLSCFHDDVHFCLCYNYSEKRLANCFNFDHHMTFDCLGQSVCENGAQCFQDSLDCPKRSICICPPCFYGTRCQFSTSGLGLSLDGILGYHILPHSSLTQQSSIIHISLALTIIFIVIGFINGILSLITFKSKIICEVGCGLYLFGSSITTLFTFTMFGLKFLILLLTQMTIISNKTFLLFQCYSFDFVLRICLSMDQWLNACVAVERAVTAIKGTNFNRKKSKKAAKYVIIILIIIIISTSIHDPIYRRLIDEINDDDNVQRLWCIVTYSSNLQTFNSVMYTFHFLVPFLMNLISAIVLIIKKAYQQTVIHPQRTYREILREQFLQHRHLLTAPIILVILALPRLIISFISKCMSSTNDSWLFLVGYFISFIPPMLTFVVFILPSKFYKKEFRKSVQHYRSTIQRSLRLTSE